MRPSMAASLQTPAEIALGQQSHASLSTGPGAAADTGAGQQRRASLRPAIAETSTDYFARMEALAGQAPERTGAFFMFDIRLTIGCVDAFVCEVEFGQIATKGHLPQTWSMVHNF